MSRLSIGQGLWRGLLASINPAKSFDPGLTPFHPLSYVSPSISIPWERIAKIPRVEALASRVKVRDPRSHGGIGNPGVDLRSSFSSPRSVNPRYVDPADCGVIQGHRETLPDKWQGRGGRGVILKPVESVPIWGEAESRKLAHVLPRRPKCRASLTNSTLPPLLPLSSFSSFFPFISPYFFPRSTALGPPQRSFTRILLRNFPSFLLPIFYPFLARFERK